MQLQEVLVGKNIDKATKQICEKIQNLVEGEEGVIVIFSDKEDVTIASAGIHPDSMQMVLDRANEVWRQQS